jgi:hypothetical protein
MSNKKLRPPKNSPPIVITKQKKRGPSYLP